MSYRQGARREKRDEQNRRVVTALFNLMMMMMKYRLLSLAASTTKLTSFLVRYGGGVTCELCILIYYNDFAHCLAMSVGDVWVMSCFVNRSDVIETKGVYC